MRKLGEDNSNFVREKLDPLLTWPDKDSSNPKGFYEDKPPFDRTVEWFGKVMGFDKYQTPYTFTDSWDKVEIMATFLVPKDLQPGDNCPIMWYFHGGGFVTDTRKCTGAGDHVPWYSKASLEHAKRHKAIVIAPDYPLGPEAHYKTIADSVRDFLRFYKEDGCFEAGEDHWTQWLAKAIDKEDVTINREKVFIEGESAGAHAAVTAMFLNADKGDGAKLNINAALLRYPMIAHYERSFPSRSKTLSYMGHNVFEADAIHQASAIVAEIEVLQKLGLVPTRARGYAPEYMAPAFLLSTTGFWKYLFQRRHQCSSGLPSDERDYMDCLERAEKCSTTVESRHLPPIVMYHGHDDLNCPYHNTEKFKQLLMKYYPEQYVENETVFLEPVTFLNEKAGLEGNYSPEVGHGFDYALRGDREPFLKRAYERVDRFWPECK
ncbi:alpha/beta-hydrolase [Cucurbitaria berberidis CBS 394.84]|uniref:Alpha/beta-hydrolase n=1 Tax=Cucurbitaria berberidis CBS 394.84 TaxID=1168544 RepID=A0A9P4GIR5_9PLEO|nr:alpha/beta-hydrolase [Cucurbitaria berberidis CBS 394.84]KAF1846345.1 alpha/beta-hydrolase [Cucurbitaria berberidis CBS 394.84]